MDDEKLVRRIIVDLANMEASNAAAASFSKKYDLGQELTSFTAAALQHHTALDLSTRVAFLKDLAQRLWGGAGDGGGIEILKDFLFPSAGEAVGSMAKEDDVDRAAIDYIKIDWRRRGFVYLPRTNLQRAFYYLLQNSDLAKVCGNPQCRRRYFIAKRANARYCSAACFTEGQRLAKREWWDENGYEWRAVRSRKKLK